MNGNNWIDANTDTPDDDISVLLFCRPSHNESASFDTALGYREAELWFCQDGMQMDVTHWQDLPGEPDGKNTQIGNSQ